MTQPIQLKQVWTCSQDHYQRADIHQRGATLPIRTQENQYTYFWDRLCTCRKVNELHRVTKKKGTENKKRKILTVVYGINNTFFRGGISLYSEYVYNMVDLQFLSFVIFYSTTFRNESRSSDKSCSQRICNYIQF